MHFLKILVRRFPVLFPQSECKHHELFILLNCFKIFTKVAPAKAIFSVFITPYIWGTFQALSSKSKCSFGAWIVLDTNNNSSMLEGVLILLFQQRQLPKLPFFSAERAISASASCAIIWHSFSSFKIMINSASTCFSSTGFFRNTVFSS